MLKLNWFAVENASNCKGFGGSENYESIKKKSSNIQYSRVNLKAPHLFYTWHTFSSLQPTTKLMSTISIRKATGRDARDIASVHVGSWRETYRGLVPQPYLDSLDINERAETWISILDQANYNVFVAIQDGKVCGFISGGGVREPAQDFDAEFYAIYILHAAKGKGMGRLLMRRLAETLHARGYKRAILWVLADNPSRGFYERLGGQQVAQKTAPVGGVDLLQIAYGWYDLQAL